MQTATRLCMPVLTTTFNLIVKPLLGTLVVKFAGSGQQKQHVVPDITHCSVIIVQISHFNYTTYFHGRIRTSVTLKKLRSSYVSPSSSHHCMAKNNRQQGTSSCQHSSHPLSESNKKKKRRKNDNNTIIT